MTKYEQLLDEALEKLREASELQFDPHLRGVIEQLDNMAAQQAAIERRDRDERKS